MMTTIIASIVLIAIVGSAIAYIVRSKKKGVKCIGCPDSGACAKHKESGHNCCH